MKFLAMALRLWSFIFALFLGLFCAGVGLVLLISGTPNYRLDMLPWFKGSAALYALLALGVLGVASALLAYTGKAKPLLAVFCTAACVLIAYGFFMSPIYRFGGAAEAWSAFYLLLGALGAALGSLLPLRQRRA